jgi:hypothetical protein
LLHANAASRVKEKGRNLEKSADSELMRQMLACASEQDLLWAAQAVVDAALWSKRLKHNISVSEQTRQLLIEAIFEDPTLTGLLFWETTSEFH